MKNILCGDGDDFMSSVIYEKSKLFIDSIKRLGAKRLFSRVCLLLLVVFFLWLLSLFSLRYYFLTIKPQREKDALMNRVEAFANASSPISGDILILGQKYGLSCQKLEKDINLVPCEEADIERGIMAYGIKDRFQMGSIFYFNECGELIGGKCRQYSYAELSNYIVEKWGKGGPLLRYSNYDIYVNGNNGRIYLVIKYHEENGERSRYDLGDTASLIMVENSNARFLLSYLLDKQLLR
jgi:hypothetical protein